MIRRNTRRALLGVVVLFMSLSVLGCQRAEETLPRENENVTQKSDESNKKQAEKEAAEKEAAEKEAAEKEAAEKEAAEKEAAAKEAAAIKEKENRMVQAKGLYLTATSAGARLSNYVDLANRTEINAYVIDVKNDYGTVTYDSNIPLAQEIGAIEVRFDIEKVVQTLKENDIYSIARIVCFKDPILAEKKLEYSIKNNQGGLYRFNKTYWVDPYNQAVWQYNIDLAKEVLAKGFDEVQFDYVRFPDGRKSDMVFQDTRGNKSFSENINDYLQYARSQMPHDILSADIFAIVAESPGDTEGIGQHLEEIGKNMDYICLMAYPSHYALGQIVNGVRFSKPDLDPYGVIKNTLLRANERLKKLDPADVPKVRTYLQDFTASWIGAGNYQTYGAKQLRDQIQAVYDAGYAEWLVWDHMNNYSVDAFKEK